MEDHTSGCTIAVLLAVLVVLVLGFLANGWNGVLAAGGILLILCVLFVLWLLAMAG